MEKTQNKKEMVKRKHVSWMPPSNTNTEPIVACVRARAYVCVRCGRECISIGTPDFTVYCVL